MINKRKTLKILGVGALCLATVLGVAGCGNTLDKVGDKSVLLTASEAMEIQNTAMNNYYTAINKADGTIEIINTSCDTDTGKNEVSKTYVGMVDGKKTAVNYTNNDSYTIYHVIDVDNFTYYRKEDDNFWKSNYVIEEYEERGGQLIFSTNNIEEELLPMDCFYQGYKNEDGSYVLQYRLVDIDRESDWTEDKYYTSIYDVEINVNKDMQMQTMIMTHTTTFSSTLTNEEIETVKGSYASSWNSTASTEYNYNYTGFSEEWVKGLMQNVDKELTMEAVLTAYTNYYYDNINMDDNMNIEQSIDYLDDNKSEDISWELGKVDGKNTYFGKDGWSYKIAHIIDADTFTLYSNEPDYKKENYDISLIDDYTGGIACINMPNYSDIEDLGAVISGAKYDGGSDYKYVFKFAYEITKQLDGEDKYYVTHKQIEIRINANKKLTNIRETGTTTFSSAVTAEEIENVKANSRYLNYTKTTSYNYYRSFNEERVKDLMQEVDNNVAA